MRNRQPARLTLVFTLLASGAEGSRPAESPFAEVGIVLEQSCHVCHGPNSQQGGINFADLVAQKPFVRNRETWSRVIRAVESGIMPPEGAAELSDAHRRTLLTALDETVNRFDYSKIENPGFEPLRRLTHTEYDNTIRDLVGADLKLTRRFTSEMTGETGFDNSATTLFLQPNLMERYIAAAERLVEEALPNKPTTADHRRAHETVFLVHPAPRASDDDAADMVIRRFLLRAFRRPPTEREVANSRSKYDSGKAAGLSFEQALKPVFAAALISPNFLLRIESAPEGSEAWRINDWELASRLSYFLWASMPDDELFDLAASNRLQEPQVLVSQLQRMLADNKANTLGTVMAGQWLGFARVGNTIRLGPIDFPWCTDSLMDGMRSESSLFFMSLLRENAPISRMLDANPHLLRHAPGQRHGRRRRQPHAPRRTGRPQPRRHSRSSQHSRRDLQLQPDQSGEAWPLDP